MIQSTWFYAVKYVKKLFPPSSWRLPSTVVTKNSYKQFCCQTCLDLIADFCLTTLFACTKKIVSLINNMWLQHILGWHVSVKIALTGFLCWQFVCQMMSKKYLVKSSHDKSWRKHMFSLSWKPLLSAILLNIHTEAHSSLFTSFNLPSHTAYGCWQMKTTSSILPVLEMIRCPPNCHRVM